MGLQPIVQSFQVVLGCDDDNAISCAQTATHKTLKRGVMWSCGIIDPAIPRPQGLSSPHNFWLTWAGFHFWIGLLVMGSRQLFA